MTLKPSRRTLALYLLAALALTGAFALFPGMNIFPRATLVRMADGSAYRPYVTRALMPALVLVISQAMPASARTVLGEGVDGALSKAGMSEQWRSHLYWEPEFVTEFVVACALCGGCFWAWLLTLRGGLAHFYPDAPARLRDGMPLLAAVALPFTFSNANHVYDPATLWLFAWGALLIAKRSRWYVPVFALACFNKETAVFLVPLFWAREREAGTPAKTLWTSLACQVALCAGVRLSLGWAFRGNAGGSFEMHHDENLALLTDPARLLLFGSALGVPVALCAWNWKGKSAWLRFGLLATLGPLLALMSVFGMLDEMRDYYEAMPFLLWLSAPTLWHAGARLQNRTRASHAVGRRGWTR